MSVHDTVRENIKDDMGVMLVENAEDPVRPRYFAQAYVLADMPNKALPKAVQKAENNFITGANPLMIRDESQTIPSDLPREVLVTIRNELHPENWHYYQRVTEGEATQALKMRKRNLLPLPGDDPVILRLVSFATAEKLGFPIVDLALLNEAATHEEMSMGDLIKKTSIASPPIDP